MPATRREAGKRNSPMSIFRSNTERVGRHVAAVGKLVAVTFDLEPSEAGVVEGLPDYLEVTSAASPARGTSRVTLCPRSQRRSNTSAIPARTRSEAATA